MSNFRQRAAAVKAAGEKRRGEWQPTGKVKASYDYWLANSKSMYAFDVAHGTKKENFCHFWRVVLFWSPMHRIRKFLKPMGGWIGATFAVLLTLAALTAAVIDFGLVNVLLFIGAVTLTVIAFGLTVAALVAFLGWLDKRHPQVLKKISAVFWTAFVVAALATLTLAMSLIHIVAGFATGAVFIVGALVFWKVDEIGTLIEGRRALREEEFEPEAAKEVEPRQPGKIAAFVKNFGDFIVLIAQVVRVNKWKICPIVELENK